MTDPQIESDDDQIQCEGGGLGDSAPVKGVKGILGCASCIISIYVLIMIFCLWTGSQGNHSDYHCLVKGDSKLPIEMAAGLDKAAIDKLVATEMKDGTVVDITADNDWLVNQYCIFYITFAAILCCGLPIAAASQ